ncbi:hypothetical protein J1N35_031835 [Gossypium stocksii]|uniref:Uncharacterized protein n=1 Tax=Gossypium stocksii TaxID=47602 RepID=A0A9D3ZV74_9ROSI|nr:hypothetical protein J1N35_031835 [Gossypium stocksii]
MAGFLQERVQPDLALVGFAVTGTIISKFSLGLTEEDAKNSPFAQKHKRLPFSAGGVEVQVANGPPVAFQNYLFPTVRSREGRCGLKLTQNLHPITAKRTRKEKNPNYDLKVVLYL